MTKQIPDKAEILEFLKEKYPEASKLLKEGIQRLEKQENSVKVTRVRKTTNPMNQEYSVKTTIQDIESKLDKNQNPYFKLAQLFNTTKPVKKELNYPQLAELALIAEQLSNLITTALIASVVMVVTLMLVPLEIVLMAINILLMPMDRTTNDLRITTWKFAMTVNKPELKAEAREYFQEIQEYLTQARTNLSSLRKTLDPEYATNIREACSEIIDLIDGQLLEVLNNYAQETIVYHPGKILREEFLVPSRLTLRQLAHNINVPEKELKNIVAEKTDLTKNIATRLALYFDTAPTF
ncbi:3951_t:CDS:2 [Ambispora leptoticha]|uniref:3951_t:CDS:1 n=1 Tax=Ambispora leptoticha TaxID=144679 RepID=A0A9N8V8Q2_9GLOM|nr:3951_t:CDS:2 [Ambispora leptoticha]